MNLTDRNRVEVGTDHSRSGAPHYLGRSIDNVPHLLEQSYRLRYEVYCLERKFLPAEHYPSGLEIDEFDCHALHVGALDNSGALAGTARAVKASAMGLPLFDRCTVFPHEGEFHRANPRLVEVGRLVVGQRYRRPVRDVACSLESVSEPGPVKGGRRRVGETAYMTVLKALYQATRRIGVTHWVTAMEEPLRRQLARQGFSFQAFGPECDYYGLVVPYQIALRDLDAVILSGRFPGLDGFVTGLHSAPRVHPGERPLATPDSGLLRATVPLDGR